MTLVALGTDKTAGIPIARARIALWDVTPPTSATIACTFSFFRRPVMDGVKSRATSTVPGGTVLRSTLLIPSRMRSRSSRISRISLTRCRVNSSSTPANSSMNILQTVSTAASATAPPSICSCIWEIINGSWIISICPRRMAASCSPVLASREVAIPSVLWQNVFTAVFRRVFSSSALV